MANKTTSLQILWDIGTAYDFFISLRILHDPSEYGLRPAWASGMRQRLPKRDREMLENFHNNLSLSPPFKWLYSLPDPKDSASVLDAVQALSPVDRIFALSGLDDEDQDLQEIYREVVGSKKWQQSQVDAILEYYSSKYGKKKKASTYEERLAYMAQSVEFSDKIVRSLRTYYEVFFEDEERRIYPAIQAGLERAQEFAGTHSLPEILEELSQGVRYSDEQFQGLKKVVLVPSFWASPFLFISAGKPVMFVFGARPDDASVVPGEVVPDALMASLNALSDPTRLKILRYLSADSLTPTQLATRLRLRPPTVAHHLKALRAAGLVLINAGADKKEVHYQTRTERLNAVWEMLRQFVDGQENG